MTRFSAAAIIAICWFLSNVVPVIAQPEQGAVRPCPAGEALKDGLCVPDEGKCFPWQEFRQGKCVAKPMPGQLAPTKCIGGTSNASGQCACPANTHLDAGSGSC